jgi:uncharacterized protein (DUF1778 family)
LGERLNGIQEVDGSIPFGSTNDPQSSIRLALRLRISGGYTFAMPKVLLSLPEPDLRVIDAAARKAGETRSSFLRRAALAEARRVRRPLDEPAVRRAFERLMQTAERRDPITTAEALKARDRGRR